MPALWRHGATNTPQSFFLRFQENSQYATRCEGEEKKVNKNEKNNVFLKCDVVGVGRIKQFQEKLLRRFSFGYQRFSFICFLLIVWETRLTWLCITSDTGGREIVNCGRRKTSSKGRKKSFFSA